MRDAQQFGAKPAQRPCGPAHHKAIRGKLAYLSGAVAEDRVAQDYERRGYRILAIRWRGQAGEIDLIVRSGKETVFVEVKKARCFDRALGSLSQHQVRRIYQAAEEYMGHYTLPRRPICDWTWR